MTNGFGRMPDYRAQITPRDRWNIVAYIRALQLSQHAAASDVPGGDPTKLAKPAAPATHRRNTDAPDVFAWLPRQSSPTLRRWRGSSSGRSSSAAIGLAAGAIGAVMNLDQFLHSWLIGFLFCLGMTLGSLALLMLQHLSGGQWGLVSRRVFEAATRTLPIVALFFIPILLRLPVIFEWARPEAVDNVIIQAKAGYLNQRVLHRPGAALLRVLDAADGAAQPLVGRAGPRRRRPTPADSVRFRTRQRAGPAVSRARRSRSPRSTG